jgi:hypothetical protein
VINASYTLELNNEYAKAGEETMIDPTTATGLIALGMLIGSVLTLIIQEMLE